MRLLSARLRYLSCEKMLTYIVWNLECFFKELISPHCVSLQHTTTLVFLGLSTTHMFETFWNFLITILLVAFQGLFLEFEVPFEWLQSRKLYDIPQRQNVMCYWKENDVPCDIFPISNLRHCCLSLKRAMCFQKRWFLNWYHG